MLQNSQENTCARDYSLIKLPKFDLAPFFTEHLWWLAIGLQLYLKKVSGRGIFLWILWSLIEHLFSQNTSGGCLWISKKMLLQTFSDTPNWIYNIHKQKQKIYCKRFEHIPCLFSGNIFDYDWILYGTS